MSRGHMQSFNLLALKLWLCIDLVRMYRQLCCLEKYIVKLDWQFLPKKYYAPTMYIGKNMF